MSPQRKPHSLFAQLVVLTLIELTNFRWTWRMMLLLGIITPLSSMIGIRVLFTDVRAGDLTWVYCGNVLLSLMFEHQNRVGDHVVFMRLHGTLDYLGSLPVRNSAIILALSLAFFILSLPSLAVVIAGGALILNIHLRLHPLLIVVVPACAVFLAAIGALVGSLARTSSEAASIGYLITLVLSGVGPVIIPPHKLPSWLIRLGALNPAAYASSALRQTLLGDVHAIGMDLLILVLFALVAFAIVARQLNWRQA